MDVGQLKNFNKYPQKFREIIKNLKYKNYKLLFQGTSSYESQYYYSDYDLFTDISKEKNMKVINNEFYKILSYTHNDLYFIEFKIQFKNGTKKKYFDIPFEFDELNRDDIDYYKIDYVLCDDNILTEVSIIYNLNTVKKTNIEILDSIEKDKKDYLHKGMVFKALKRQFSIYKMNNTLEDKKKMVYLSTLFNSSFGKLYKITSNLNTLLLMLKKYGKDKIVKQRVKYNIMAYNLKRHSVKAIKEYIKEFSIVYNNEALKYYKKLF